VPQSTSKTNKAQAACCWWYGDSSQTVAYLMMDCQKWRRARGGMLKELGMDKFAIRERRDRIDLENSIRRARYDSYVPVHNKESSCISGVPGGVSKLPWVAPKQCRSMMEGLSVLVQGSCNFLRLRMLPRAALLRAICGWCEVGTRVTAKEPRLRCMCRIFAITGLLPSRSW
jgi:hypothetical protein